MGSVGLNFGSATSGQGFDVTTTVNQIVTNLQLGRTFAHTRELEKRIEALTPDEVTQVFRKYVDPQKLVIVRAGDFK